jgi:hypothetical protein
MKNPILIMTAAIALILVAGTALLYQRIRQIARETTPVVTVQPVPAGNLTLGKPFPKDLVLRTPEGETVKTGSLFDGEHFVVVNFHNPDCPCAANCGNLIGEMQRAGYDDVRVVGILVEGTDDPRVLRALDEQRQSGQVTFPIYFDADRELLKALGATRTPEIWLMDKSGVVRFWGAPENTLFPGSPGHRYYLREAIDALRAGQDPNPAIAPPIGCIIGG